MPNKMTVNRPDIQKCKNKPKISKSLSYLLTAGTGGGWGWPGCRAKTGGWSPKVMMQI